MDGDELIFIHAKINSSEILWTLRRPSEQNGKRCKCQGQTWKVIGVFVSVFRADWSDSSLIAVEF